MDRKQMCVANVQYKKPGGERQMKNLMRYLTYRESRDEKARFVRGVDRWTDHGMGRSVKEVADHCSAYASEHVVMFSLVINPNPDLVALVPEKKREQFVRALTERTVEDFFDVRGIDNGVEWSAVLHHRLTDDEQMPGQHNPHMHIVLPGTYYDPDEGIRKPLYFSRNKAVNHIEMLHSITQDRMSALMEHYVGRDWEQRIDTLEAAREQERSVIDEPAHGDLPEIGQVWSGTRIRDEETSDVGIYGYFDEGDGDIRREVRFRSLIARLPPDEANLIARYLGELMKRDVEVWAEDVEHFRKMNAAERTTWVRSIEPISPPAIAFEIDL